MLMRMETMFLARRLVTMEQTMEVETIQVVVPAVVHLQVPQVNIPMDLEVIPPRS